MSKRIATTNGLYVKMTGSAATGYAALVQRRNGRTITETAVFASRQTAETVGVELAEGQAR